MFASEARGQVLELGPFVSDQLSSLGDVTHPVRACLNALAPSSRRPQLSALGGVLRECWHGQLMTTSEYQAAISVPAIRGESERRGRDRRRRYLARRHVNTGSAATRSASGTGTC
jgi:hypothetical protein